MTGGPCSGRLLSSHHEPEAALAPIMKTLEIFKALMPGKCTLLMGSLFARRYPFSRIAGWFIRLSMEKSMATWYRGRRSTTWRLLAGAVPTPPGGVAHQDHGHALAQHAAHALSGRLGRPRTRSGVVRRGAEQPCLCHEYLQASFLSRIPHHGSPVACRFRDSVARAAAARRIKRAGAGVRTSRGG